MATSSKRKAAVPAERQSASTTKKRLVLSKDAIRDLTSSKRGLAVKGGGVKTLSVGYADGC